MKAGVRALVTMMTMTTSHSSLTWDTLLAALRSGEYNQGVGGMCHIDDSPTYVGRSFCPLGVIRDLAGTDWQLLGTDRYACDDDGETGVPSLDLLEMLGLRNFVNYSELGDSYRDSARYWYEHVPERWEILVYLNDFVGYTFQEIADEIERLGWH